MRGARGCDGDIDQFGGLRLLGGGGGGIEFGELRLLGFGGGGIVFVLQCQFDFGVVGKWVDGVHGTVPGDVGWQ